MTGKIFVLCLIFLSLNSLKLHITSNNDEVATECDSLITDLCDLQQTTGTVKINNDTLFYYIYSSKVAGISSSIPLIGINGGPGASHHYMLPLKKLACLGTPLILYDQIGTGNSTRVTNLKDFPYLLTIDHYITELSMLIKHLNLDHVHVLGHSWGTIVAKNSQF